MDISRVGIRIAKDVNEHHKSRLSHMGIKRVLMWYPENT